MENYLIRNLVVVLFCSLIFVGNTIAGELISPGLKEGDKFQRKEGKAFLRVGTSMEIPGHEMARYSFHIFSKTAPDLKIGFICVTYCQKQNLQCESEKTVSIDLMEVDAKFRGQGYGEAGLRTVLGIFRSPQRKDLLFDRFLLSVGTGFERIAARSLYAKVGFAISSSPPAVPLYQYMSLDR